MKRVLLFILSSVALTSLYAQNDEVFNPEGFTKEITIHVNTDIDEAFYLMGPKGRKKWLNENLKKMMTQEELLPRGNESAWTVF